MNTGHTTLSELDAEIWSALATLGEDDSERGLDWRQLLNLLNGKAAQVMQTLAAEREKVRVLREELDIWHSLANGAPRRFQTWCDAIHVRPEEMLRTARQALAATAPEKDHG